MSHRNDDDKHDERNYHEPPKRDSYQEKLDRWKEGWNRELDDDLANGR